MEFDYNVLEEKFKQLPEDIQEALTSPMIAKEIENIANKNGLLLDQASTLFDLTSYVLLGLVPSGEFVRNLSKEAGIDTKVATAIANQINLEVLPHIRTSIREIQDQNHVAQEYAEQDSHINEKKIASVEAAGGFSVIRDANKINYVQSEPTIETVTTIPIEQQPRMAIPAYKMVENPLPAVSNGQPVQSRPSPSIIRPAAAAASVNANSVAAPISAPTPKPVPKPQVQVSVPKPTAQIPVQKPIQGTTIQNQKPAQAAPVQIPKAAPINRIVPTPTAAPTPSPANTSVSKPAPIQQPAPKIVPSQSVPKPQPTTSTANAPTVQPKPVDTARIVPINQSKPQNQPVPASQPRRSDPDPYREAIN